MSESSLTPHVGGAQALDHEYRVIGAPGTGKTTYLARQCHRAAEVMGGEAVMVCSLTKTAAAEVAGRNVPIPKRNVGTLHSFAYHALGRPVVATSKVNEWNDTHRHLRLSQASATARSSVDGGVDDRAAGGAATEGDKALAVYGVLRARLTPRDVWPHSVRAFARAWEAWKRQNDYYDFQDMIEFATLETHSAMCAPRVMFVDEAQDFSHLEMRLVRKWAGAAEKLIVVGDPDQALYSWAGADPDVFRTPALPAGQMKILPKSYRVPRAVHEVAMRIIRRHRNRPDTNYEPRPADGNVRRLPAARVVRDVVRQVEEGRSVMVLASCGYLLNPLIAELRTRMVPFHNPYRADGRWNPLRFSTSRVTPVTRVLAYMRPCSQTWGAGARLWLPDDLRQWVPTVGAAAFRRGAKKVVDDMPKGSAALDLGQLADLFSSDEEFLAAADPPTVAWLVERLMGGHRKSMGYAARVLEKHGAGALMDPPRVVVGTINSVKGAEADVVYLLPDLSRQGFMSWTQGGGGRDEILRLFYVGCTRAREELVLCSAGSKYSAPLW